MNYQAQELFRSPPTLVESTSRQLRNAAGLAGLLMEILGTDSADLESMKRGVGLFAVAGIAEIIRRAEHQARNH